MGELDIHVYQDKIKAAHKFEVVDSVGGASLAGKKVHFIGAGGIGMSGLAQVLLKNKAIVSGSDQMGSGVTERLCRDGADIKIGHDENNLVGQMDAVVYSAAIAEDNPELKSARASGCKVYKYAQMLGELMGRYAGVAVAGTHGKSTTTGWLSYCLKCAGFEPSFIVGADVTQLGGSSGVGDGEYFVAEACEYDRSFLNLKPKIGCILNIEQDHLDCYKDEDEIVDAFCQFALNVRPGGVLIANGEDSNVAEVMSRVGEHLRCETFGFEESCNFSARDVQLKDGFYNFDIYHNGELLTAARVTLPGRHNVLNSLAVAAMAVNVGVEPGQIAGALVDFSGIDRRLMLKDKIYEITILDDYAHHPTEIRASLEAIRQRYNPRRLWCIFQPHQYSRTRFLLDDFAESFKLADVTIVPSIYFVRDSESARKEVNSEILVEKIRDRESDAVFIDDFEQIYKYLMQNVSEGDLVVTMGAGDIWKVADGYIQWLRDNS